MQAHYAQRGVELNEARLRMATLPTPAEVLEVPDSWVPLVHVEGVYVLPGIPRLFSSMIEAHQVRLFVSELNKNNQPTNKKNEKKNNKNN